MEPPAAGVNMPAATSSTLQDLLRGFKPPDTNGDAPARQGANARLKAGLRSRRAAPGRRKRNVRRKPPLSWCTGRWVCCAQASRHIPAPTAQEPEAVGTVLLDPRIAEEGFGCKKSG